MEQFQIPKTRDPFINARLLPAGVDPKTGMERFWCSTWNDNVGSLGALIREDGEAKIYRFEKVPGARWAKCGFYAAALTDHDTMWLCGDMARPCRLTLSTGELKEFPIEVQPYLQGRGVIYDAQTKKLLYGNFVPSRSVTVVLDTVSGELVKVYEDPHGGCSGGFANGDGTYTVGYSALHTGTTILKRWDPVKETMEEIATIPEAYDLWRMPCYQGRRYFAGLGWFGADGTFASGIEPGITGINWCDNNGRCALGNDWGGGRGSDKCTAYRWEFETGEMVPVGTFVDTTWYQICFAKDGGAAGLSVYGNFVRYDKDGNKVVDVMLDSDSVGMCDCIIRADEDLIVGTPFISQRFWTLNDKTGEGCDRGRATAGVGEVMRAWNLNGKVYMASYTCGQITEFDPKKGGCFPQNPRIVAKPEHSLRPMGAAQSETTIYSAATHEYGEHGFELVSYNQVTGEVKSNNDPIPNQQMLSLFYNQKHHLLIGATDARSDCELAPRVEDHATLAILDPDSLEVLYVWDGPQGDYCLAVLGPKDEDSYYVAAVNDGYDGPIRKIGVFDLNARVPELTPVTDVPNLGCTKYAGEPNKFVIREGDTLYLCHGEGLAWVKEREIGTVPGMVRYYVSGGEVFCVNKTEVFLSKI